MPNASLTSFLANYRSAVNCKKIRFCIPKTVLNFELLKVLIADGYIWSFKLKANQFEISTISLHTSIKFNKIVWYSTQKRPIVLSFSDLIIFTKLGGYFILTTKFGIMNDSAAWKLKIGGILLFGIF